ncbi:hypothetical protein F442_22044 [Phytophthora nicotianae P10297]|uniref:Uncharacterized protein n=1 Tax=Phytophthora nicotianae P10297 TaxID=1317064 RepID=W2Y3C9_PHYNI|nr:hypothetical protein F442_22044 [Phytophthora nicotianae P10297]
MTHASGGVGEHESLSDGRTDAHSDGAPENHEGERHGFEVVLDDALPPHFVLCGRLDGLLVRVNSDPHVTHECLVLGHTRVGGEGFTTLDHGRDQELDVKHRSAQSEHFDVGHGAQHGGEGESLRAN